MFDWIKKNSKWAFYFILGVALIAVYKTFESFDSVIKLISTVIAAAKPFIIAFVIAYMLNIPIKKVDGLIKSKAKSEKIKNRSYGLSILCVYVLFIIFIAVALGALLPAIYQNLLEMYNNLPRLVTRVVNSINQIELLSRLGFRPDTLNIMSMINDKIDVQMLGKYAQGFMSFTSGLFSVFISLIASVYMLIDKDRIISSVRRITGLFPHGETYKNVMHHIASINNIFTQYIYARLICCLVMAVASTIILVIMREPYALILGLFIGFMDMIPYFGSIIACAVSAVIMFISGGIMHAVWCSVILLILQQIDGNVIAPKVMGTRLEIRPLSIIIAVSVGGSLFGFVGMLISVPVVAILRAIASELLDAHEITAKNKEIKENFVPDDDFDTPEVHFVSKDGDA